MYHWQLGATLSLRYILRYKANMTKIILALLLLLAPIANASLDPPARTFELMKCVSVKHGTIWASFGKQYRSEEDQPRYFPTEIVVFAPDYSDRLLFPDFREALKIPLKVTRGQLSMQFLTKNGEISKTNALEISQYDPRIENGYLGQWIVTENGKRPAYDQASCSLD